MHPEEMAACRAVTPRPVLSWAWPDRDGTQPVQRATPAWIKAHARDKRQARVGARPGAGAS
jgi:hypothetical protein